ncbi:hypothetical protein ABZP36_028950 [Zizania latifolia]
MVAHTATIRSCCEVSSSTRMRNKKMRPAAAAMAPSRSNRAKNTNDGKGRRIWRCAEARKMEALRSLVPSSGAGETADDDVADELLFRAADYIARLQVQVKMMQLMVDVLEHTQD